MKTPHDKIAELTEALRLAQSHISWCWDVIEEHTRLRRTGSRVVHRQISEALGDTIVEALDAVDERPDHLKGA